MPRFICKSNTCCSQARTIRCAAFSAPVNGKLHSLQQQTPVFTRTKQLPKPVLSINCRDSSTVHEISPGASLAGLRCKPPVRYTLHRIKNYRPMTNTTRTMMSFKGTMNGGCSCQNVHCATRRGDESISVKGVVLHLIVTSTDTTKHFLRYGEAVEV